MTLIIALDGPAGSGKSSVAAVVAKDLGLLFFDTGVMYRAVALATVLRGIDPSDETAVTACAEAIKITVKPPSVHDGRDADVILDDEDVTWKIREAAVNRCVSQVSAYAGVRKAMTDQQRKIGNQGNVIMVGRDIGTVVFPQADLKIFLDASAHERALRRHREESARGLAADFDEILKSIESRDRIDTSRQHAPLVAAADAVIIDTDGMDFQAVVEKLKGLIDDV